MAGVVSLGLAHEGQTALNAVVAGKAILMVNAEVLNYVGGKRYGDGDGADGLEPQLLREDECWKIGLTVIKTNGLTRAVLTVAANGPTPSQKVRLGIVAINYFSLIST